MKYTSLKQQAIRSKHIEVPSKGIDSDKPCDKIEEKCLSFAKNMIFENGVLSTRKGLSTNADGWFDTSMCEGAVSQSFYVTDALANIDGEALRIVYADIKYDNSVFFVFVFGVGESGNIKSLGNILFGRLDDTVFFYPESITFYSGKAHNGGGVFALVSLENAENPSQKDYCVYEIGSDFNSWSIASGFYIPTVYINGRGNAYETLEWGFESKPASPESRNLLNDSFYAYYSSDGSSSSFRLPFTDIDNLSVTCRIYYSIEEYTEWIIDAEETTDTKTFAGREVSVCLDREKGIVYFIADEGSFAVPAMSTYRENNIRILAHKAIQNGFDAVASAKCVTSNGNKNYFSGGINKSGIYYCDFDTPLYFPYVNDNIIGNPESEVTELKSLGERIIAFKQNGVYEITVKKGGAFNNIAVLPDNGAIFKKPDVFNINTLSDNIGLYKKTAVKCLEKLMWLSYAGEICSISKSSKIIETLPIKVKKFLKEIISNDRILTENYQQNYVLSSDNKTLIINSEGNCYYWELPDLAIYEGVISLGENLYYIYRLQGSSYYYMAGLKGECDTVISGIGSNAETKILPIESKFTLKGYNFGSVAADKSIKYIDLDMKVSGEYSITVGDENVYCSFEEMPPFTENNIIRVIADITGVKRADITIGSNNGISFAGGDIYYTVNG